MTIKIGNQYYSCNDMLKYETNVYFIMQSEYLQNSTIS